SDPLMDFEYTASASGGLRLPAVQVRRSVADALVQSGLGVRLSELEEDIDRDLKPRSAALTGWTGQLEVNVRRPTLPVKDMVGGLRPDKEDKQKDALEVWGTGTAKTFDKLIDSVNQKHNFKIKKVPSGGGPSDHASFYDKKIPVFFLFTGNHADYHRPSDT